MSNLPQNPVLICGDGCAKMADMETKPGVIRTRGNNSCDLLLGRERSLELSHEGVFSLLPEWGPRWRGFFSPDLGLNRVNAACSMRNRLTMFYMTLTVRLVHRQLGQKNLSDA